MFGRRPLLAQGKRAVLDELRAAVRDIEAQIEAATDDVSLSGELTLSSTKKSP